MSFSIPIARTNLTDREIESVLLPLKSGWLVQGTRVRDFEESWCKFTGSAHSVAVNSCTSALHLSLAALGFGPGDEAIVPAFTWASTANVIEHLGGKVVFCDINLDTFNIDVQAVRSLITSKTKAIIPVHLFGLPAQIGDLKRIADDYGIWVVEDAACGFGSKVLGKHVGTFGDTGCFSFHPRKAITTGEGGMITTDDADLAAKLRSLRDHGAVVSDLQRHQSSKPFFLADHVYPGFNYRMTDIQGALGATQMERAQEILEERKAIAKRYDLGLSGLSWLQIPVKIDGYEHGYQSYPCLFMPSQAKDFASKNQVFDLHQIKASRNLLMEKLQKLGISTRPATHAVHMLSFYASKYEIDAASFPNSYIANECSISLPLFHGLTNEEQDYVVESLYECVR